MTRLACLIPLLLLTSCGAGNSLQGSLSDQVSLQFTSVRIESGNGSVAVSYLESVPGTTGQDTVLEIVASTAGINLTKGGSINLTDAQPDGSTRGQITRAVHDDARRTFPPVVRGSLRFDRNPAVGAKVTGSFNVLFGQGGDLGSGRTAFGGFAGTVIAAGQ